MHIKPGLHSEQQRRNFLGAARLWTFGGPLQRRCGATTKVGAPCGGVALRDHDRCRLHARLKRPVDRPDKPLTAAEIAKRVRRQAVNRLRIEWRRDPWAPGCTLMLPVEAETDFRELLAYAGEDAAAMPPAAADWARWKYRQLVLDRDRPGEWAAALDQLRQRVRAAGPPPPGWRPSPAVVAPELGYVMAGRASPYSRRRTLPPAVDARQAVAAPVVVDDAARAVLAFATHRQALTPALAAARGDTETRLALALAYDRLVTGESGHAAWLEAMAAARR